MRRIRLRRRNLKRKENWLKKATAALCSAVLLAGLAEGADSLSVQAVGDTKDLVISVRFSGDVSYSDDIEKTAKAFMEANDLTLKEESSSVTEYQSTTKKYDGTSLYRGFAEVKYSITVPKDVNGFVCKFSGEDIEGGITSSSSSDTLFTDIRYGCYFVDGDSLLYSQYLRGNMKLQELSVPSKSGHVFKGWVTSKGGTTSFVFNQYVNSETKIYASWQDWELTADDHLTISSQDGMNDWNTNRSATEEGKVKTVTIDSGVTEIPADAFRNCSNVEKVYIVGNRVPQVGSKAFDDCKFIRDGKRGIVVPADMVNTYKTEWPGYACYITASPTPEDAHDYGSGWESDDKEHWHECDTCGIKTGTAEHTEDNGTVTQQPTETQEGVMTYRCSVCAYEMRTEAIPVITPSVDIEKEVKLVGDAPRTDIITSVESLAQAVLTEEEMQKAANGTDVTIRVTVEDADDSVSDADKGLISAQLDGYTAGKYLDISMVKKIGADEIQVTEVPGGSIQLVIQVPDNLKNTDPVKVRKFRVIRVHDGTATVLNDMDDNENTITIETDRFSTYALVYQDVERPDGDDDNNTGNNTNNNTNTGNTNTGGTTNTGNANIGNTNTRNTNTGGTTGTGTNSTTGGANTGTTGTTNTGTSNQARGNALRTGDIAPVGFYTMIALCFLGIMIVLERKQQLNGVRLIRRLPRPY